MLAFLFINSTHILSLIYVRLIFFNNIELWIEPNSAAQNRRGPTELDNGHR